ncbi:MAG: 30S ribosomal protein S13 [bacterium]|nr:30S ribosomal protein S13 [bacterium]
MEKEQPKQEVRQLIRILNTDIPGHLHIRHALTKIRGVGDNLSHAFCARYNIDEEKKVSELSEPEIREIEVTLKSLDKMDSWMLNRQHDYDTGDDMHLLTTDLRFRNDFDIKRLQKIKAYKGMRHSAGLPVRGQRTKAHFRKGRAVGVSKKKVGSK